MRVHSVRIVFCLLVCTIHSTQASPIISHDEKLTSPPQLIAAFETQLAQLLKTMIDELSTAHQTPVQDHEDDTSVKPDLSAASSPGFSTSAITGFLNALSGGLNSRNVVSLIDNFESVSEIMKALLRISPPLRRIVDETSKTNAEFRVLFKTFNGKFPSLKDLYELVTSKQNKMWYDYATITNNDPTIKIIVPLLKARTPDYEKILNLLIGSDPQGDKKYDDGKYTVKSSDIVHNKNVIELVHFLVDNWQSLNLNTFPKLFTNPLDYPGILGSLMSLDFSHFPTSLKSASVLANDKYALTDIAKPGKAESPDRDLAEILRDIHILGPQILKGQEVEKRAEDDVIDILKRFVNTISRLLGVSAVSENVLVG